MALAQPCGRTLALGWKSNCISLPRFLQAPVRLRHTRVARATPDDPASSSSTEPEKKDDSTNKVTETSSGAGEAASSKADDASAEARTESVTPEVVASHPIEGDEEDLFAAREMMDELKDRSKFGSRGEIWFVMQAIAIALVLFPPVNLKGIIDALGALFVLAGFVFVAYGVLSLGRNLYPLPAPRAKNKLVTTGMYSYVRHPLYAGLLLVALGVTCITGNETRLALTCGLWYILERKIQVEESFLLELHGQAYVDYMTQVKKLIPFVY